MGAVISQVSDERGCSRCALPNEASSTYHRGSSDNLFLDSDNPAQQHVHDLELVGLF